MGQMFALFSGRHICVSRIDQVHVNGRLILGSDGGSANLRKTFRRLSKALESVETLEVSFLVISYNITIS